MNLKECVKKLKIDIPAIFLALQDKETPIAEHPCDNSWGYQQTGFYSPTDNIIDLQAAMIFLRYTLLRGECFYGYKY